ncbi:hypothetical protein [Devosia sp. RR2S18]|uniref:hypothetical protein n=1 Tax=Devosia rhizosphaerae TaxID=3049774 RepID=UPI0025411D4E|nr:hypothetical protein [Devosia sp. RR2S18]WIJ26363.1 hypothetical protein QOV41_06270 [Devosia sp. RR2S18]
MKQFFEGNEGTIFGSYIGGEFKLAEVVIFPADEDSGEPPTISFLLTIPGGSETVSETIVDGELPNCDGCWADNLQQLKLDGEENSDLLYSVNEALRPLVAGTALDRELLLWEAERLRCSVEYQGNLIFDQPWLLKSDLFSTSCGSLHQVQYELKLLAKAQLKRRSKLKKKANSKAL